MVSGILSPELQRLNYGVVFEAQAQVQLSKEIWIHTFEIQLPEDISMIKLSGCNRDVETCSVVNNVLLEMNQIRQETEVILNNTLSAIAKLVPERKTILKSRTARSILPLIGDLSKTLFGTATIGDVELLAKHINALNKLTTNIVKSVSQHEDHLSSYIKTVDDRMNNLVKGIKENELAISHIHTQLYESFSNLEQSFSTMSVLIAKQIEKSRKLEHIFGELLEGIYSLVEGKLSPHLISPDTMLKSITDIQSILHNKFKGFHLVYTDPNEVFKNVDSIYARKNTKLYISVKFPISSFPQPLSLFHVLSFPVPINDTSNHATQLLNLPPFIAVTHDLQYYATFKNDDLDQCVKSKLISCKFNKVLTPVTHNSCILALFKNDKTLVKNLCDFRVSLEHLSPKIVALSHTSILIYKIKFLELDCKSGKRMIQGCKFCILNVPCQCSVTTTEMYLPPRLSACHENTTSTIHPINLALLQQFFNDSSLKTIESNTLFDNPLLIEVPKFQIYNHSMNNIIADDRKAHLSLQKMAKAARKESVVFRSLTEPLISGNILLEDNWPTTDNVILYVTSAVAIFSLIAFIVTFLKLRKVLLILSILQQTHINKVNAATMPSFVYKYDKTTQVPSKIFFQTIDLTIEHYILILCICILLIGTATLIYTVKCKSKQTVLLAELTNGESCVHVPLRALTVCPTYWNIKPPSDISIVSIRGLISPTVSFEWDNFELDNKLTGKKIKVKNQVAVSPITGRKIRQILTTTYCIYFFIQHENLLLPISDLSPIA